jgi:hypothetical protein
LTKLLGDRVVGGPNKGDSCFLLFLGVHGGELLRLLLLGASTTVLASDTSSSLGGVSFDMAYLGLIK